MRQECYGHCVVWLSAEEAKGEVEGEFEELSGVRPGNKEVEKKEVEAGGEDNREVKME